MTSNKRKTAGETIVETLVALLITSFAMLILPGAVIASAKVDATVEKQITLMNADSQVELSKEDGMDITVTDTTDTVNKSVAYPKNEIQVYRYGDETGGLYRYEMDE